MGRKSREKKKSIPSVKKGWNKNIILAVVLAIIAVGSVGVLVMSSYTNLGSPPIPKSFVRVADITIASFPGLPKTSKQVMTKALFETSRVKSGEHNFTLKLTERLDREQDKLIFSLDILGIFEKSDNQIDLSGTALIVLPNSDNLSEVSFVELDDFVYFKADNLPNEFGLDLSKLGSDWYKVDITKVTSEAKANVRSDEEIEETIKEKTLLLIESLDSEGAIRNLEVLPDQEIDGRTNYRYKITLDESETKKVLSSLSSDTEVLPSIKEISFDLWINKSSFIIDKIVFNGVMARDPALPSSNVTIKVPDVNFELTYELKNANGEVELEAPESANELSSLLDLYLLVQDENKKDPSAAILGAVSNIGEFGTNFLTVERLIHVLYLTPQSF